MLSVNVCAPELKTEGVFYCRGEQRQRAASPPLTPPGFWGPVNTSQLALPHLVPKSMHTQTALAQRSKPQQVFPWHLGSLPPAPILTASPMSCPPHMGHHSVAILPYDGCNCAQLRVLNCTAWHQGPGILPLCTVLCHKRHAGNYCSMGVPYVVQCVKWLRSLGSNPTRRSRLKDPAMLQLQLGFNP